MRFLKTALPVVIWLSLGLSLSVVANESVFPDSIFAQPQRTPGSGVPETRSSGATRPAASCPKLRVLAPTESIESEKIPGVLEVEKVTGGQTVSDAPVLWFEISEPVPDETLTLVVKTAADEVVHTQPQKLSPDQTLISISLPGQSLTEENTFYYFEASMTAPCVLTPGETPTTIPLASTGWLEKVTMPSGIDQNLSQKERAIALAQSGIWFDAFDIVAKMYSDNPDEAWTAQTWKGLLEIVEE